MNKRERRWAAAAIVSVLLVVGLSASVSVGLPIVAVVTQCPLPYLQQGSGQSAAQAQQQPRGGGQVLGMGASSEQAQNAAAIIGEVKREGMPQQAAIVAVAAAQAESGLRNLNYGDRDSLGLFQQRPSQGWGSSGQIMDPRYAVGKFFDALVKVPGWRTMRLTAAAQAVQRSANPAAYASAVGTATQLVQQLWGGTQAGQQSQPQAPGQPGFACQFQSRPQPQGQPQTKPIPQGGLPFPIPAILPSPGWKQPIPVPSWPAGLPGTRVNPPAITPQCVAGALWAWAAAHLTDPAFAHPPAMSVQSAYQMTAEAQRAGFKMDSAPRVGDMVVFRNGSFYGPNGHVGLVVATSGNSYLVAEQNFMNAVDDLGPHWGTWDLRSIGWPDAQASGFIAAPPS